jgi:predicted CXXCH cytochrome family protein
MMKRWTILFFSLLILALAVGCQVQTRYRVLCVLFDGVPPPEGLEPCDDQDRLRKKKKAISGVKEKKELAQYNEHGPYAAKLCEGCHQRQTNKLLMPVEDLCMYCHVFNIVKKNVHGPLASGSCVVCHDPHGSGNRYLLVAKSEEFCLYCHQKSDLAKKTVHQNMDSGCTTCHNAHASNNDYLLRDAPDEPGGVSPWGQPQQQPKRPNRTIAKDAKVTKISVTR